MKKNTVGLYVMLVCAIAAMAFGYLWSAGQGAAAQAFGCAAILAAGAASFSATGYLNELERRERSAA